MTKLRGKGWSKGSIYCLVFTGMVACSTPPPSSNPDADKVQNLTVPSKLEAQKDSLLPTPAIRQRILSLEAATLRSKQVARTEYSLEFRLNADEKEFQGKTKIKFDLKPKAKSIPQDLFLDFEDGTITSIILNGKPLLDISSTQRFDGHQINFKLNELEPAHNTMEITYTHPYSTDGNGLHRFKDPVDSKIYLYSNFEPFSAHRLFPCFDQPDLKGTFEVTAEAPEEWQVISNTLEKSTTTKDGRKTWTFPPSAIFSTYVFALHAGPYSVWKSDADGIPLRIFSRKSLAKYVDFDEWFRITQKGLDFYAVQFGIPYPFGKYDQIIVPDFNAGAMENVGAVTFSENFVYRTRVTHDQRRNRANVILHEMAHMWFGDLVTMRWWNGLWLNESFATFMATWAVDETTSFKGSWQAFFSGNKQSAYREDHLVTTHPVEQPVNDTDQATASFDSITYGKGASALKQLKYYLGEDEFREGLQRYFEKYAYRNTTLSDFMKMLNEASSEDLSQWPIKWLQTTGANTIRAEWKCETPPESRKAKISEFVIIQDSPLRPHRAQIALFNFPKNRRHKNSSLTLSDTFSATYDSAQTSVKEAIGKPCPDFVFPNYQDYDYVKTELDPVSFEAVSKNVSKIEDPFTRQMLWQLLWEMVIDNKLRPQDYADIVLKQIGSERETLILSNTLRTLVSPSSSRESVLKFLTEELRAQYQPRIEKFAKEHLMLASKGGDQQLVWFKAFLDSAQSPASMQFLQSLLKGKHKLRGITLDQPRRWDVIQALARNGTKDMSDLIASELKLDPTDMGQKAAIAAEASLPDLETKNKWLKKILRQEQGENLPLAKLREAMDSFHTLGQEKLFQLSSEAYFENLPRLSQTTSIEDSEYSRWFSQHMFPSLCDPSVVAKTSALIESHPELPAPILKNLKIGRQEEERCIKTRKMSLSGT